MVEEELEGLMVCVCVEGRIFGWRGVDGKS